MRASVPARTVPVPGLIAYSDNGRWPENAPPTGRTVEVPSSVPFVAATGTIVGYVHLDALLVSLKTDNPVETAFALESRGIARGDIASLEYHDYRLLVRVRPITAAQVQKIASVVDGGRAREPFLSAIGFVSDCGSIVAPLGGLAVAKAREHARVMARGLQTHVGAVLGVVDSGWSIPDAVCGAQSNSSIKQLVMAARRNDPGTAVLPTPRLYATVSRSVSVAWQLDLPPNAPGFSWQQLPEFRGRWEADFLRPPFIADGQRAQGDGLLPNVVEPDRVRIIVPDWAASALERSPYAGNLFDVSIGLALTHVVDLRAPNASSLQQRIDALRAYLERLPRPIDGSLNLSLLYSRDDCSAAIDNVLYRAARDAFAKTHGHVRYIEERPPVIGGPVSCLYEPDGTLFWQTSTTVPIDGAAGSVEAGY
jgi:hypothetical protein